ncbi:reverse transcriptase family protein [Rhizophagus irregularis DAOM 181602=DAOM 197198]|nr:reverse transcriptase family protein [Rhizophagus irregularis DAOM 181602=DAOM 197198]
MPFKTIKNLFSWSKQKLLSLRTTNRETETTRKVETEEGDFEQRPNTPQKQNIQDRNTTRTQQTENNYTQQNANVYNNNTYNLTFMGHNINGLGPDHSKLNLLIEYCSNKGADIIGDLNSYLDRTLDYSGPSKLGKKPSNIITWLDNAFFTDTYRKLNPKKRCFTWKNKNTSTRIDYIWADPKLEANIRKSHIYQSIDITDSDHNITLAEISFTNIIVTNNKGGRRAEKSSTRIVYDYENTTNEQWNRYEKYLNGLLKKHKAFRYIENHGQNEDTLNKLWDIICNCIQQAALKHIPHKKIGGVKTNFNRNYKEIENSSKERKDLLYIRSIMRKLYKNELKGVELRNASKGIKSFNQCYGTNIAEITEDTDWHTWKCETRNWLKIVRRIIKIKDKAIKEASIKKRIEERNSMITKDQRKMINSILDKTYSKINLDRIRILTDTQEEILLNSKEEVHTEAINAYSSLFRSRNHKFENLPEQWKEIYELRKDINPEIYEHLNDIPTEQEWYEMLETMNDKSAPGISNISYKLIKKAGAKANDLFRQYTGLCYLLQNIPMKWKISQLYPIPKTYDWDFNLARTRPILLIECLRKCAVKITTKRLENILSKHEILKGPNYAGLPGESTSAPLSIINGILEDAREENKTVWIVAQDMAKAFDSVGMVPLQKALERIRLPPSTINFIINIYKNCKIKIITAYGVTDTFTACDGIDQGEVISPLIWRIFYDPLLHRIQEDEALGYCMELNWPDNVFNNNKRKITVRTAVSAYADDTQWIAKSKNEAEEILLIADEFFDINDIKINGEKTEIIVVNPEESNENERFLEIGKNNDKVFVNKGSVPIRILGVWFKADKGDKHIEAIVKKEISTIVGAIRHKHITHAQAIYIINTVLLPRLEYRLKTTVWEDKKYEEIFKPVMQTIKHKTRLPSNCHDNILLHSAQGKLKNLWRNQIAAQISEFLVTINSQSKQADVVKMRLKKAQLILNITSCILLMEPDVTVLNKMPNNHAYNVMRKAHDYLFKFQPLTDNEEWDIPLIGPNVRNFVYQQASKMHRKDKEFIIRKAASMSIYGALQLVNQDASDTVTWQQICDINKRPARGRTPQWFNSLTDIIQKAPNLKNYYMTDKAPFDSENRLENDGMYLKNAQAFRMPKKLPSTDNRKKEFVHMQQDYTLTFGQINKKLQTGKHTIQHWTTADSEQRMDNEVPYKLIKRCGGCSLNDRRVNKENRGCFFNKDRTSLTCINRVSKYRTDPDTRIIKDIIETRGYPQLQQNVEHSPSYIQMVDYDTALIQNTLVNNEAMTQHIALLQQIRSTFNPSDMINIYTDGSLTNRFNNSSNTFTKYMGTGWVILNSKDEVILECSSSITDWPSSTCAELGAILSAILVLQTGQKANILTDSQAAIDSINYIRTNLTNGKNKTRIWCKCNNYSIVSCIINLIDSKRLEIKLVKVKGHSGVKGNEEADRVAKNDTNSLTCIKIKDSQQKDLIYDIYWDGIRVDRHIRKFIDNLCESTLDAAWSLNRTHRSDLTAQHQ